MRDLTTARTPGRGTHALPVVRGARLRLNRIDPWSVMKIAFLLSIALFIILLVALLVVWLVLDSMGVFESVGATVQDVTGAGETGGFDLVEFLALPRVLGFATLVGIVNVVLVTALATLAAFLYNIAGSLAGGVEVTLTEPDQMVWED